MCTPAQLLRSLVIFVLASCVIGNAHAQGCDRGSRTAPAQLSLMDSPPTYSTRDGWRQGTQIASIPRGETIRMCETREIGFFVSKQRWHRVQWRDRIGWIDDSVITGAAEGRRTLHASLFASAYAHDAEPARS